MQTHRQPPFFPSPEVSKGSRKGPRAKSVSPSLWGNKIRAEVSSDGPNFEALRTVNMTQLEARGVPAPRDSPWMKNGHCGE